MKVHRTRATDSWHPDSENPQRHCRVVTNHVDELRPLSEWLLFACSSLSVPDALASKIELVVNEVVANVIDYGYPAEKHDGQIRLSVVDNEKGWQLEVEDDGVAFDPTVAPDHPGFTDLQSARVGGLGVLLIHEYADGMRYERRGESNSLILDFFRKDRAFSLNR